MVRGIRVQAEILDNLILPSKLNIQKTKIMASGPITSWQIDGETMKIVKDLILGGFQKSQLL